MASYTVSRSKHATLGAGVVDTVNLTAHEQGVEVINHDASSVIYVTFDGPVPTVAGDNTLYVPVSEVYYHRVPTRRVRLISAGTPAYSVQGVP